MDLFQSTEEEGEHDHQILHSGRESDRPGVGTEREL